MDTGNADQQLELFPVGGGQVARSSGEGGRMSLHLRYDQLILVGVAGVIGVTVVFAFGVERGKQLAHAEQSVVLSSVAAYPTEPGTTPQAGSAKEVPMRTANRPTEPGHPPQGGWAKDVSRDAVSRPQRSESIASAETGSEHIRHVSSSAAATDAAGPAASIKPVPPSEPLSAPTPAAPDTTIARKRSKLAAKPDAAHLNTAKSVAADQEGKSRYVVQLVTYSRPQLAQQELSRLKARGERAFLILRNQRAIVYVGPFPSQGRATERLVALKPRYQDCFLKTL